MKQVTGSHMWKLAKNIQNIIINIGSAQKEQRGSYIDVVRTQN